MPGDHRKKSAGKAARGRGVTRRKPKLRLTCALTADIVVISREKGAVPQVLLIQRGREPFKGRWALPGGFVEDGERSMDAARRELFEETGVHARKLHYVASFSEPGRDPRGRTVTEVYAVVLSRLKAAPRAGDDARRAAFFPLGKLPPLAFDHQRILKRALEAVVQTGALSF